MADGELGFLGLTHNPFATENNDFFEGGDRKTHLEQLRHLGQWSRRVTLVTGPLGVGKTTLYRQLSMTLEPRVRAARINGVLVNTAREVLASVAQGVGTTFSPDANVQTIAQALATYIIGQERFGRYCLVMVDDAHLLDFQSLEELLKLTKNSPAHVCLFGEPGLVNAISKPAARNELTWHEIRLAGLALPDIEKYLTWKLSLAQYRGRLPFSPTQLSRLTKVSGGLPAAINHVGAELIERLESGKGNSGGVQFPVAHGLLVVLLVVVVSLAYLVLKGSESDKPDSDNVTLSRLDLEGSSAGDDTPDTAVNGKADVESETGTVEKMESADQTGDSTSWTADASAEIRSPLPLPDVGPDVAYTSENAGSENAATEKEVAIATEVERGPMKVDAKPVPPVKDPVTPSAPVVAVSGSLGRGVPPQAHDAAWLNQQSPSAYTVQLVSLSTEDRLIAYLGQQRDAELFAWYPIVRGGKRLYVVTYGRFDSKTAAEAAVKSLPKEIGKIEPWVRPMKLVQDAIAAGG